ncbi:MAG: LysR family transcriptional regulator [Caldilineaceae bacterium]
MLNLYKLEIFVHVVEEGSFSGAAERLLMTQSGVSQHIQDLEASLGSQLFERGRRGVNLTAAGKTLYEYTERILDLVSEAEKAVVKIENLASGQITVGATPGISAYLLPDWIQEFRSRYPRLTVLVQTSITPQIVNEVLAHRLDMGLIEGELTQVSSPKLRIVALKEVEQFVVVGRKHAWWNYKQVALTDLCGQSLVVRQAHSQSRIWLEDALKEHNIQPVIAAEFDNPESLKRAAINSALIAILPDYVLEQELQLGLLRIVPVENNPLRRTIKAILPQDRLCSPVGRAFLTHLKSKFPQLADVVG